MEQTRRLIYHHPSLHGGTLAFLDDRAIFCTLLIWVLALAAVLRRCLLKVKKQSKVTPNYCGYSFLMKLQSAKRMLQRFFSYGATKLFFNERNESKNLVAAIFIWSKTRCFKRVAAIENGLNSVIYMSHQLNIARIIFTT